MTLRAHIQGMLAALVIASAPASAQDTSAAVLVADQIAFEASGQILTASGNVEVFHDGTHLRAGSITYDGARDKLIVTGPITLFEGANSVIFSDYAELSADLQEGLLRGARLVLNEQVQIAATEITRSGDGRYLQAYQTVASSCNVCASNPVPLWQIRAKRVIHDTEERQIYFEQAQVLVMGVPVVFVPTLRLPDPTQDRSTGFLIPELSSDEQLGTGIKIPYFIAIDPHRDLTLTPYISTGGTRTLEGRYRQAFANGDLVVNAALSDDDLTSEPFRGYVFAEATFDIANDFELSLDLELVSDPDYLLTYGISEKDRLDSRVGVTRTARDEFTEAELIAFQSLRASEDNRFLPTVFFNAGTTRRFEPDYLGGIASWSAQVQSYYRRGDNPAFGVSRDVARLGFSADWERSWVWDSGLVTRVHAEGHLDHYQIRQDPVNFADESVTRLAPYLTLEARLPLARSTSGGVRHVVEPVVQAVLARSSFEDVPNEDSTSVDFDEGNLFFASRFAGRDAREEGSHLNIGLTYSRYDPAGWNMDLTLGRVVRDNNRGQFNPGTGLDGVASDWLAAMSLNLNDTLLLQHRALFDDQISFARSETLLSYTSDDFSVQSGYTFLEADVAAGRPIDTSEWSFDAGIGLGGDWTGNVEWRYDFLTNDASRAGVGLTYVSDCVKVDFEVSRRFTNTTTLEPSTRFGISVGLTGFGAGNEGGARRNHSCAF